MGGARTTSIDDETLRVGLAEVLDLASEKPEDAYTRILEKVNGWTSQLKPAKPTTTTIEQVPALEPAKDLGSSKGTKPQPTVTDEDRYLALPWKQSQKKPNLGTILVTPEILENSLARELYDRLKDWKTSLLVLLSPNVNLF